MIECDGKSLERDLERVTLAVAISLSEVIRSSLLNLELLLLLDICERRALKDNRLGGLGSLWHLRRESSDDRDFLLALGRKLKIAEKSDSNGLVNVR